MTSSTSLDETIIKSYKILERKSQYSSSYMKLGYSTTYKTKFLELNISKLKKTYIESSNI